MSSLCHLTLSASLIGLLLLSDLNARSTTVKLSTSPVSAVSVNQGTTSVITYITKMKVTGGAVVINAVNYTVSGIYDNNDLTYSYVYFNSMPSLSGASYLGGTAATYASPHSFSLPVYKSMNANDSGYFIITMNVSVTATDNNNFKISGATSPVTFGYSTVVTINSSQVNGGVQTIEAADLKTSSSPVPALSVNQGTSNVVTAIVKMKVSTMPVVVNKIIYTLSGNHDNDDLTYTYVYFNTTPTLTGANYLGGTAASYSAPHQYGISTYKQLNVGDSGYFIITVSVSNTASDNNTIKITGATIPVTFEFTTAPNVIGTQTNSGVQTIQAPDIKLSSVAVAALNVNQGTTNMVTSIVKMKVSTMPVNVSGIVYTLSGNHDNDDLTYSYVYFNTTPTLTGASYLGGTNANYAAPHTYTQSIYKSMNKGDSGYFIITTSVSNTATDNKTFKITGATTPVSFGYVTAPNVTGTQTNSGVQTIQAADIKVSSSPVAAAAVNQGSNNVVTSITKLKISTMPVVVNNIGFTLSGTHDDNDLNYVYVYFNTTPDLTGSSYLGGTTAGFSAPHVYSMNIYKSMNVGDSGYFIVTTNVNNSASNNKTFKVTGATTPVTFGYTTSPNSTGTQTNSGVQTIKAAEITLSSQYVAAGNAPRGSTNNLLYTTKMVVATMPVVVTSLLFTFTGTHDADDLTYVYVYFNSSPTLTGATYLGGTTATFAAPHTYSQSVYKSLSVGETGYFLITFNVDAVASTGKTVILNGNLNPVIFGYTTAPNTTNNQTNSAGIKTITVSAPPDFAIKNDLQITGKLNGKIYPNPAKDKVMIEGNFLRDDNMEVLFTNAAGRVEQSAIASVTKGKNFIHLDVSKLNDGYYFITFRSAAGAFRLNNKLFVQKR